MVYSPELLHVEGRSYVLGHDRCARKKKRSVSEDVGALNEMPDATSAQNLGERRHHMCSGSIAELAEA